MLGIPFPFLNSAKILRNVELIQKRFQLLILQLVVITSIWVSEGTFGDPLVGSGLTLPQIGFTGREFDSETGLMYYRARYYDPQMGRFLSEDPIGFGGGDSNLSRYVLNSPYGYRDPSGKNLIEYIKANKVVLGFGGAFLAGAAKGGYSAIKGGCGINDTILLTFGGGFTGVWLAMYGALIWESLPLAPAISQIPFAATFSTTLVLNIFKGKLVKEYIRTECQRQ